MLALVLLPTGVSYANVDYNPELAASAGWRALLSYRKAGILSRGWESQADAPEFFLSEKGKYEPAAELSATIKALELPPELGNEHPRCRFPARYHWLQKKLQPRVFPPAPACPEFAEFRDQLNAKGATIVFPASYLNSASSMFGHTLLRLDQHGQDENNRILAATASYAADTPENDSSLSFVFKGLFGGYPGSVAIRPYFDKLKEYRDIESRDIWEYKLNLSQEETDQLVRYLWEIRGENFHYYFFTENCSYRLLGALDVVRPEQPLLDEFNLHAIPVDTLRAVLKKGFVENTHFRPSATTQFRFQLNELEKAEQDVVHDLVREDPIPWASLERHMPARQSLILDVAVQYSRLVGSADRQAANRSLELLLRRNSIETSQSPTPVPQPDRRDDEGHLSGRLSLEYGYQHSLHYTEFGWRPAYHDLTDPGSGYPLGSELQFFDTRFRVSDEQRIAVESLTLVGIKSLSARDRFLGQPSWSVRLGGKRRQLDSARPWVSGAEGLVGAAANLGGGLAFGLFGAEGQLSAELPKGYDILARIDAGYVRKSDHAQLLLGAEVSESIHAELGRHYQLHLQQTVQLSPRWNAYASASRTLWRSRYETNWAAGLRYYF